MSYRLVYTKEDYNVKDYKFEDFKTQLVKTASTSDTHIIPEFTPISNQKHLGSCVANSVCDSMEIILGLTGKVQQLSRLFVYWNARMYTKSTDKDEGCFIRNAFDSVKRLGICLESTWEYDTNKVFAQPPLEAYREASDNKVDGFYRITTENSFRIDDIEFAIRSNCPVVFGTGVSSEFTKYFGGDGRVWNTPAVTVGNHAMIVVGVRNDGPRKEFLIRNSWGEGWGDKGRTWFDSSYLSSDSTLDLWVSMVIPAITL